MSLRLVKPVTVTSAMLISSNGLELPPSAWSSGSTYAAGNTVSTGTAGGVITVWESVQATNTNHNPTTDDGTWWLSLGTTYSAWSSGTTYAAGATILVVATHRVYESVQAGNTNHDPTTDDGTWWIDIGPTNKWAMLDTSVGTTTTRSQLIDATVDPGIIGSLALLDVVDATSVTVTMLDAPGGTEVYSQTFDMGDAAPLIDWYAYFFDAMQPRTYLLVDDLPPYSAGRISVSVAGDGVIGVGTLVIGDLVDVGDVRHGVRVGIIDYSRKETDTWGVTRVVERAYAKRVEAEIISDNGTVDFLAQKLASVRAVPVVWLFDDAYSSLVLYGWIKDWSINIAYPNHSEIGITVEGLV
jgi:hypothetical protein